MIKAKDNSFDALRLLLAFAVVVSHSFYISGYPNSEYFNRFTDNVIDLGTFAVKGFFVISGFLIVQSLKRSKSWIHFLRKRVLRIFPALFMLSAFSFVAIPFFYRGEIPLLQNTSYQIYPLKVISLFHPDTAVDGLFANHPEKLVNASLWTLPYEVICYALVSLLFFVRLSSTAFAWTVFAFLSLTFLSIYKYFWLNEIIFLKINLNSFYFYDLAAFFSAGALLSFVRNELKLYKTAVLLVSVALIILSFYFGQFFMLKFLVLPPFFLSLGMFNFPKIQAMLDKYGDLSYGVYIYGFFIQQCVWQIFNPSPFFLTVFSLPIILVLAYFSWIRIEKPALRLKNTLP